MGHPGVGYSFVVTTIVAVATRFMFTVPEVVP
jgi:hypothetical protein